MTNEEIKVLCHEAHNVFFKKWRDVDLTPDSERWEELFADVTELLRKYKGNERAKQMILWYLDEIDRRCIDAYGGGNSGKRETGGECSI